MSLVVAVVGSGTGVGKTRVAWALTRALATEGEVVCGLKPIETGGEGPWGEDARLLSTAGTFHVKPPPYRSSLAQSPHLAVPSIELGTCVDYVRAHPAHWSVVETAGGLRSPLRATEAGVATNLELLVALRPDAVIMVTSDRLGALHDALVVREAVERAWPWGRAPEPPATPRLLLHVLSHAQPDEATLHNHRELSRLSPPSGRVVPA
jgi:dethiobiotin synthetase